MQISTIQTGFFKLDGGAMFGVVPKKVWSRLVESDEDNMWTLGMRALLIKTGGRTVVIDTGIGTKQDERFRSHFSPFGQELFQQELLANAVHREEVTDVLLTHFHFDHAGGAIMLDQQGKPVPTFPNATYWTCERHYRWAIDPNPREKASFPPENFTPLHDWGILLFAGDDERFPWLPGIELMTVHGHTEAMYIPVVQTDSGRPIVYCADLIPSIHHLALPYVMAYDIRPLQTMEEKARILDWAHENNAVLVFEHDANHEACTLARDHHGRITPSEKGSLLELLS